MVAHRDALQPEVRLLTKLGSMIVHADEFMGAGGHEFDLEAFRSLLADPDVAGWLDSMRAMALLPLKRS